MELDALLSAFMHTTVLQGALEVKYKESAEPITPIRLYQLYTS